MPPPRPPVLNASPAGHRSRLTLGLCTILHAFTHAYGTLLVPLYLMVKADLGLGGVNEATFIVTVYGLVYCLGSYAAGVLADRHDRRLLLGVGLLGNAVAVLLMGLTRRYELLIALGVLAGLSGTLFHPAASALVPAHFPKSPGMAIGMLGVGSGLGFFAGPQFAGWRAESAGWHLGQVADWQRPCVELGAAGLFFGVLFLLVAREAPGRRPAGAAASAGARRHTELPAPVSDNGADGSNGDTRADRLVPPLSDDRPHALGKPLSRRVLSVALVLGCRDFAGVAGLSLASIYLQKAHGLSVREAGFAVGAMMLLSVIVNPLAVYLTPGRRRLPALVGGPVPLRLRRGGRPVHPAAAHAGGPVRLPDLPTRQLRPQRRRHARTRLPRRPRAGRRAVPRRSPARSPRPARGSWASGPTASAPAPPSRSLTPPRSPRSAR